MAGFWRTRRKLALTILVVLLSSALLVARWWSQRGESYTAGEETEGLFDTLARDIPEDHPSVSFTDVASASGFSFEHFSSTRTDRLPEDMGSGVALGDANDDGWTDAFLVNITAAMGEAPKQRSQLFLAQPGGRFEDATQSSGINLETMGMGAAFVDVDSDGDLDLLVTNYGRCSLLDNDGKAHFKDISVASGIADHEGFWTGAAIGDIDVDGAMDLYVCGYVIYDEESVSRRRGMSQFGVVIPALINPSTFKPERNLLFMGKGDGTFAEMAEETGVQNPEGRGLGAMITDFNDDGWPDLYVANDVSDNALFLNRGGRSFIDVTTAALVGDYRGAMGLAAADINDDLSLELFITHWVAQENALYTHHGLKDLGDGGPPLPRYIDEADRYGLGAKALRMVGWGTRFFDYDNDGLLDLFVVNGHTIPDEDDPAHMEAQRTHLFWNSPNERGFIEVGAVSGDFFREPAVGRGGASFDYDLDGDEDLVIMRHGGSAALLRNDGGNALPTVRVRLRQPEGNRFAIGAHLIATIGEANRLAVVGSQGSYLSQHAVGETAFGLGTASGLDTLEVVWPDGMRESTGALPANSLVTWTRGSEPRVEVLPGRRELDMTGPTEIDAQRAFYALREKATRARLDGETASAVVFYRQALAQWTGHVDCLYYLGNSLVQLAEEAQALAAFERLVHFEPISNKGWMQIGLLRLPGGDPELDDLAAAHAAFLRCQSINREESRPALQLGITALLKGELEHAEELLSGVARLNPRSIEARWFLGKLAFLKGNTERAKEWLSSARELALNGLQDASVSSEGNTKDGAALTSEFLVPLSDELTRWQSVGTRPLDIEGEYGG